MNDKVKRVMTSLVCICFIYVLLFLSIQVNAFSRGFYSSQNSKIDISAEMDMSKEDYQKGMNQLLSYLEDSEEDIDISVEIREIQRPLFNEKEATHMVDVKVLYQNARMVAIVAVVIIILAMGYLLLKKTERILELLSVSFLKISIAFLFLLTFLGLYASVDFTSFWTMFHKVFFANDLWLLNPATDNMIQMLPQDLFFALVFRIIGMFIVLYGAVFTASFLYQRKQKRQS